jgi:hypothetical protein
VVDQWNTDPEIEGSNPAPARKKVKKVFMTSKFLKKSGEFLW